MIYSLLSPSLSFDASGGAWPRKQMMGSCGSLGGCHPFSLVASDADDQPSYAFPEHSLKLRFSLSPSSSLMLAILKSWWKHGKQEFLVWLCRPAANQEGRNSRPDPILICC
jgi:hypothetical protein